MSTNNITGDALVTKIGTKEQKQRFDEGFERIFGQKKDPLCDICGKNLKATAECAFTGCPLNWDEGRIDNIGQNGPTGEHYEEISK
jgi:hypothetical protein